MMTRARFFAVLLAVVIFSPNQGRAETSPSVALTGHVSSREEGPMEGVLVSAKKDGSIVTITVVSDAQGQYSFPRTRLEPGHYAMRIRAVGYDLSDPGSIDVTSQKPAQLDLKLAKTKDLASQLTNAEWLMSAPGTEEQKKVLFECAGCHTFERIFRSHYTAADFPNLIHRMAMYDPGSIPAHPQVSVDGARDKDVSPEYLSSINLSSVAQWQFPLKTLPRPKGEATRVIMTEYDLPRPLSEPHDVIVNREGIVWYGDFGNQFLGRLDPKTAKIVEYPVPVLKPGLPIGYRVLLFDPQENIWISMGTQAAITKFDPKTEKFQIWKVPAFVDSPKNERAVMLQPGRLDVDGKIWVALRGSRIQRMDIKTGEWEKETINPFAYFPKNSPGASRPHALYDILPDSHNNLYFADFGSEYVGKIDGTTKEITYYQTQTFDSGPRRAHVDQQDRFWFGEDRGGKVGMLDPKTWQIQEWTIPIPFSEAYDANIDKDGEAWAGGMMSDRLARVNTKTGNVVQYLLPRSTNVRKVELDTSTNPVTIWIGSTHGASIIKVEPLE
jgi:virginiamycin B lyase